MPNITLGQLAAGQHGLLTRVQILGLISGRQLEHRVRSGVLVHARPGVYRVSGVPVSWVQNLLAVCLSVGPEGVASFRSAAALWGLPGFAPGVLEISTPRSSRVRLDGVIAHQSQIWRPDHTTVHRGVPVTSVARTICDLTALAPMRSVALAMDDALRRNLTTVEAVQAAFIPLAHRGRRRGRTMRALIDERSGRHHPGESPAEERIVRWLTDAGLPRPVQQHRIPIGDRTVRVDAAYPELEIAIEYDGWDAHRTRTSFDADRARGNELEVRGWVVLRFTSASSRADVATAVAAARKLRTAA